MVLSEDKGREVAETFLQNLRTWVKESRLSPARLPGWITFARVRVGWVNSSLILVFEDALNSDAYQIRGQVGADTTVLLNIDDFLPKAASLKARADTTGLIVLQGEYGEKKRTVLNLAGELPALFNCGYDGYHGPLTLFNIFLEHKPGGADASPIAARYVPFALYAHERDITDPTALWVKCEAQLTTLLLNVHNSETGSFYEQLQRRAITFALNKLSGVIVLGKDTESELQELIQVRDHFRSLGYDAEMIKDLPEIPMMSNEEKVRLWTLVSRFAIMIDRHPAGQIAEYVYLREQRTILAVLRPQASGSTFMIGDDTLVDVNYIKVFSFSTSPLSVADTAKDWAESMAEKRILSYGKAYPWRDH